MAPGIDKNSPDYFEILFGTAKLNAVTVDVNWRLAPPEMAQIVNDAEAKVLIVGPEFIAHLDKIAADLTTVKKILIAGSETSATYARYDDWVARHDATDAAADPGGDDVCIQLYTSGTTGLPKGVMLTNANLFTFIGEVAPTLASPKTTRLDVVMPVFHIGGSAWAVVGMALGARTVLHAEVDPVAILQIARD